MELKRNKAGNIVKPAIEFIDKSKGEDYRQKAISFYENDINGTTKFAITKLTDNGKYMRGNLLYFNFNGIEVYTDAKNIIFVDLSTSSMFIREYEKVIEEVNPTDPETKQYILLYTDLGYDPESMETEEFPLRWEAVTGRTQAYNNIKINAPVIDIDQSLVLVESVSVKDSLTVRQFCEYLKNSNIINEESFDINDFVGGKYI